MYFRQSLKRSRQQMVNSTEQLILKTSATPQHLVSNMRDLRETSDNMTDRSLLTPPKDLLTKGSSVLGCSPLLSSSLRYPQELQGLINSNARQRDVGYSRGLYWMYCDRQIHLWTCKDNLMYLEAGVMPCADYWRMTFEEDIVCVQFGQTRGLVFEGQIYLCVLVIAFLGQIRLFCFDGRKFDDMKISYVVSEQVHQVVFSQLGSILYAGSSGYVTMLINNSSSAAASFRSVSSLSLSNHIKSYFRIPRPYIRVRQLVIDDNNGLLYSLVSKTYSDGWFVKKLFGINRQHQHKVVVYRILNDRIEFSHQFTESRLTDKLRTSSASVLNKFDGQQQFSYRDNIEIMNVFISRAGFLGVALKTGVFIVVKNTMSLDIEFLGSFTVSNQFKVLFEKSLIKNQQPQETRKSLGLDNLTCSNTHLVYFSAESVDVLSGWLPPDGQLVEKFNQQSFTRLRNTLFQERRQWLYFHRQGIELITKYTIAEKLLIFIDIKLTMASSVLQKNLSILFRDLCNTVGVVELCSNLIEIICNTSLTTIVEHNLYEATVCKLLEINDTRIAESRQALLLKKKTKIVSSFKLRYQAKQLLKMFEYVPVINQLKESQNIYTESLGLKNSPKADSLWYSILLYFTTIFETIKDETADFFKKQPLLVQLLQEKLRSFRVFLIQKEKELSNQSHTNIPTAKKTGAVSTDTSFVAEGTTIPTVQRLPLMHITNREANEYPINITVNLVSKMIKLVEKTNMLIYLTSRLSYFQSLGPKEPTLNLILMTRQAQIIIRNRAFQSLSIDDPLLVKLEKVLPQVISKEDILFEQWLRSVNKGGINIAPAVRILDVDRLQRVRDQYAKLGLYKPYYELIVKRVKHLSDQKQILETLINEMTENIPGLALGNSLANRSQLQCLEEKKLTNANLYGKQLEYLQKELETLIENIKRQKNPNDIRKLDELLSVVYSSDNAPGLQKCLEHLERYMMIPHARYLKTHPLLKADFLSNPAVTNTWV